MSHAYAALPRSVDIGCMYRSGRAGEGNAMGLNGKHSNEKPDKVQSACKHSPLSESNTDSNPLPSSTIKFRTGTAINTFSQLHHHFLKPVMPVGHFSNRDLYLRLLHFLPCPFTERVFDRVAVGLKSANIDKSE